MLLSALITAAIVWYIAQRLLLIVGKKSRHLGSGSKWVVMTGATDGIGRSAIVQIAKQTPTAKIVLVGRNEGKLKATEAEIRAVPKFSGEVRHFKIDLSKGTLEDQAKEIAKYFKDMQVGTLICNAGISHDIPPFFNELTKDDIDQMLNVNLQSLMAFVHVLIGRMKSENEGTIICTGSMSRVSADALHEVYCTSKSAVAAFCNSLQCELRPNNILVQCLEYGYVKTKLAGLYHQAPGALEVDDAARWMIHVAERGIVQGWLKTPTVFAPHPLHMVFLAMIPWIPRQLWERIRFTARLNARAEALKAM